MRRALLDPGRLPSSPNHRLLPAVFAASAAKCLLAAPPLALCSRAIKYFIRVLFVRSIPAVRSAVQSGVVEGEKRAIIKSRSLIGPCHRLSTGNLILTRPFLTSKSHPAALLPLTEPYHQAPPCAFTPFPVFSLPCPAFFDPKILRLT